MLFLKQSHQYDTKLSLFKSNLNSMKMIHLEDQADAPVKDPAIDLSCINQEIRAVSFQDWRSRMRNYRS